jgi:flagellar biosynthesis/type III secretory pathway chaperone
MKTIDQLTEILKTEVELVEALIEVLDFQRQSIIYYNVDALSEGGRRQQELLKPFESLEQERIKATEKMIAEHSIKNTNGDARNIRLTEMAGQLPPREGESIRKLGERLREASKKVVQLNEENGRLIEHTQRFIHNNVRMLTENFSRQLVDQKM